MSDTVPSAFILLSCPPSYQLMHELLVNLLTGENKAFVLPVTRNLAPTEAIHSIFWVIPIDSALFHVELKSLHMVSIHGLVSVF